MTTLTGTSDNDTLYGTADNDLLVGGTGSDLLQGATGNDTLKGGAGNDLMEGNEGSDTYIVASGDGADTIRDYGWAAEDSDTVQFLDVKSTELRAIEVQGGSLVLKYGPADQLTIEDYFGSGKIEQLRFSDGVTWDEAALMAQVFTATGTANDDILYGHYEGGNRLYGLDGNDTLYGDAMADRLDGGADNDTLYGWIGNDTLKGGTGNDRMEDYQGSDTYIVASWDGADTIRDYGFTAEDSDTVQFMDVESTEITAIEQQGWSLVLKYGSAAQLTIEDYFFDGKIEQFRFSDGVTWDEAALKAQVFTVTGTADGDILYGYGEGSNRIYGLDGNDGLHGGAMNDTLNGGAGEDYLGGGNGNDILNGGAGADTMEGGDGSDTYYVSSSLDVVTETNAAASGGTDVVYSSRSAYTLGANVENGRINTSAAANLTGNGLANVLHAGAGSNVLDGAAGTDLVSYYYATAGVTVSLATTAAQATGGSGSDTLKNVENLNGSNHADSLTGSAGNNALNAGAGDDILTGGLGADKLTGGTGADRFDFNALSEMGITSSTWDTIADFKTSEGDKLDLLGVDADTVLADDQAFTFLGAISAFTGDATGQLRFDAAAHILYGSTDADTAAEFVIALTGVSNLASTDLVL